ncbi:tryptophan--tRNA ligase [Oligoflexus tunisiensis]|uniref:tryptophan--tRNA ligase n=1 Tax=Oligoflexus tunisiensis TaxID=708132 RepID=UPI000AF3575A|nr:tryptophan--tRNA ligase [Oligoflexus tunisiensis]
MATPAPSKKVILSGIQPTNRLTLGNYLGAIKNWVKLQKDFHCHYMAVDLHAYTVRQDPEALRNNTYTAIAIYIASGIDLEHCTLFVQSHIPQHAQLAWLLNCNGYMGELSRMTQYKDKSSKAGANIPVGLFTYPLLMAADILLYDTHLVPVGDDQKQHVELTRDLAQRMNGLYGDDTFVVPEPYIPPVAARVMDLLSPTNKMSKSAVNENGSIFLTDSPTDIEKKFKRAETDSGKEIRHDRQNKPGVSNLIDIQAAITGESIAAIEARYDGKMYGHLKVETAEIVKQELGPIQKHAQELLADKTELDRILKQGAEKARAKAEVTLRRVHERIGFIMS